MFDDLPISALHSALDGLSARQRAITDDVANVNTPNYAARSVSFEGSLKKAIADGVNPMETDTATVKFSTVDGGLNNNNVDLVAETTSGVQTELRYELALRATSDRFQILRTAIKGA